MSSSPDFLHSPLRFYLECGRSIHYVRIFLAEVIYPCPVVNDTGGVSNKDSGMEARISLMELLEGIHDPRRARGKRHPLPALLGLAVVAMLAGMTSYEAIVPYGKERGWEFLQHLGFTTRWGLCKATYSRVFRRLDVADFEVA